MNHLPPVNLMSHRHCSDSLCLRHFAHRLISNFDRHFPYIALEHVLLTGSVRPSINPRASDSRCHCHCVELRGYTDITVGE